MAKRLVLDTNENTITVNDLREFVARIETFDLGPRTPIRVSVDDGDVLFYVPIPSDRDSTGSVIQKGPRVPAKDRKKREKVRDQIVSHREKVAAGEKIAHVPAVGASKRKKRVKRSGSK